MGVDLSGLKATLSTVNSAMRVNAIAEEMAQGERVAAAIARESAKETPLLLRVQRQVSNKEISSSSNLVFCANKIRYYWIITRS